MTVRKYTATFTDKPGAKARYRQALKLMGAESLSIAEAEVEQTEPKPKKDNLPTTEESKAIADLFSRRHSTEWSDREIKLFRDARKKGLLTMENITILTAYYGAERRKGDEGIHRRDLGTFLANITGELDRARAAKPKASRALEWPDSNAKVIPMTPEADAERIRRDALEAAAKLKEQLRA